MAVPVVSCSVDVVVEYDASPQTISLGATASNGPITGWAWTILSVPEGSVADVGTKGDFVDGVSAIQNPDLEIDGEVDGTYVIQCVATNSEGDSVPSSDKVSGQQLIIVRTVNRRMTLPNDKAYNWGKRLLIPAIRQLSENIGGMGSFRFWEIPAKRWFVDPVLGDDANDGQSWATAKKNIKHVWFECIPSIVDHWYFIVWRGDADGDCTGTWLADKLLLDNGSVILSGEPGYNVVSGPFTATGGSDWHLQDTGSGWTPTEHVGKWVMFHSGANANHVRGIATNTADEIHFTRYLPANVLSGHTYSFVEPKSSISGYLGILATSSQYSNGVVLQHCKLEVGGNLDFYGPGFLNLFNVMGGANLWMIGGGDDVPGYGRLILKYKIYDTTNYLARWGSMESSELNQGGCSFESMNIKGCIVDLSCFTVNGGFVTLDNCQIRRMGDRANNCWSSIVGFSGHGLIIRGGTRTQDDRALSSLRVDGYGGAVGSCILILNSPWLKIGPDVLLANVSGDAITCINTNLILSTSDHGVTSGMGNSWGIGNWGVWARHRSCIRVRSGVTVLYTGSNGDLGLAGTSGTWAALAGGTIYTNASEALFARADDTSEEYQ